VLHAEKTTKMIEIPTELKKVICNNELLVFVGAGLSFNLKNTHNQSLKGWSNLVENILLELKSSGHNVNHLIPLANKYEPIKVLDLIESDTDISKKEIYKFVKDYFDLKNDNNLDLHKKLYQLSKKIITTNYDTAFETAVNELRKNKAYKGKNYELTTHKEPNSTLLFKLHGCYEDIDSMVLFPSNYKALYENTNKDAEHALLVLRNIILNKSLLFIGTGMGDFQINSIFKEIKNLQGQYNQKHFIITNKPIDSSLNFLTDLQITNYSEIDSVVDTLINIKKECDNNKSIKILELERQLEQANRKIIELKNTSNKDKLLEREALKYFTKGVEFSLTDKPVKASEEYKTALELKPDLHEALYNWGTDLGNLAKTKEGKEAEELYNQAFDKFQKAIEYGASSYNLSCILALKGEKEHALRYLNISLSKNEIDVYFVEKDEDWRDYLRDNEFIKLLKQYKG